ncbi:MAG: hypothetical protein HQL42_10855 [Alphaproteobacteria bacterium]|nr:hypothetical protein [Alphaproteobacteria bacterium]
MFTVFGVGAVSPYGRQPEGGALIICPSGIDLIASFANPTNSEIEAIRFGKAKVGLAIANGIATGLLVWRFDHAIKPVWLDTPFNVCIDPRPEAWCLPDRAPHQHLLTQIVLQDQLGIVHGLRSITIPPKLMAPIEALVESQADLTRTGKWSPRMYHPEIDALYRRWPRPKDAMRDAIRADLGQ